MSISSIESLKRVGDHGDVLIRRLCSLWRLTESEKAQLLCVLSAPYCVGKGHDIVADGSVASSIRVVLSGAACRYKMLVGGQRQVTGFLVPGDFADLFIPGGEVNDHGVSALTPCMVTRIERRILHELLPCLPGKAWQVRALIWQNLLNENDRVRKLAACYADFLLARTQQALAVPYTA
jgi:CRP-like cAMP-binding protein